jgi:hypothetical protein
MMINNLAQLYGSRMIDVNLLALIELHMPIYFTSILTPGVAEISKRAET